MLYGDLQFFDIILFAAIAGFIIYRLRSVLGKRTGFQKDHNQHTPKYKEEETETKTQIPSLLENEVKLENVYKKVPSFKSGDTVAVSYKIKEGEKERIQVFEGIVISKSGASIKETFTVRKISYGEGVERIFPVFSPKISGITVLKKGKVRRAKLYYLRGLSGKAARIKERPSK